LTPGPVFQKFLSTDPQENAESCQSRLCYSGVKRNFWLHAMCACSE